MDSLQIYLYSTLFQSCQSKT
uniref:Uncharacterized protein n=1 Tax=Anguilla anguilla TaxID=7936 RepID=A0A0E9XA72_ANGAN